MDENVAVKAEGLVAFLTHHYVWVAQVGCQLLIAAVAVDADLVL